MPKSLSVADILQALSGLTLEELQQVNAKLRFLLNNGNHTDTQQSCADDELMLLAISDFFSGRGLEHVNAGTLKRFTGYKAYKEKMAPISQFLKRAAGDLVHVERLALYRTGVELLYTNLSRAGLPVSSRTIMNQIHRIPSILNKAFPGYSQLGLLWLVVRAKERQRGASQPKQLSNQ